MESTRILSKNFINLWTSYAIYYFGKVNLSLIIPILIATMGMTKGELGAVASGFLFAYAIGQFVHGYISERFNPFTYMSVGLILSAMMNCFLGFAGGVFFLLFFGQIMDGFFQSMGWSSCVRATSMLYKDDKMTCILGTSYQIGNSIAWLVTGFIIHYFGWRWGFWTASIIMMVRGVTLQIGKPEIRVIKERTSEHLKLTLDKTIIISAINLGILNFIRYGIIIWIPTFLYTVHNQSIDKIGLKIFMIPIAGCIGTLAYNWLSKYISREYLTSIYMINLISIIILCSYTTGWQLTILLAASGFFLYGPHVFLVSTVPGRKHSDQVVATATGFIDGVGYIGAMLTGIIMPIIIDIGWTYAFGLWAICCLLIVVLILLTKSNIVET
jgi:sugar phosphate permease